MTETNDIQIIKEIVIAVFNGADTAEKVLADIKSLGTSLNTSLQEEATIVTMDDGGKLSATPPTKKAKGAVTGAVVGALVGTLFGLPIVGAALGGVVGAFGSKQKARRELQSSTSTEVREQLVDMLVPDSSMIIVSVEDIYVNDVVDAFRSRGAKEVVHTPEAELAEALAAEHTAQDEDD